MEYLECLENCYFEPEAGIERCFTMGGMYLIMGGSIHDIDGATLIDDQGSEHTVSGPWARRFRPVGTGLASLIEPSDKTTETEHVDEDLLWDKPKEPTWVIAVEDWEPPLPNLRPTSWAPHIDEALDGGEAVTGARLVQAIADGTIQVGDES